MSHNLAKGRVGKILAVEQKLQSSWRRPVSRGSALYLGSRAVNSQLIDTAPARCVQGGRNNHM